MESSELGQKMREAFEATLPSEEAVLRRYGHLRGLRSGEDLPAAASLAQARLARARHKRINRGVTVGVGVLLAAAGILLVWSLADERPVAIGPSLDRDLQGRRAQTSHATPTPRSDPDGDGHARVGAPEQTELPARSTNTRSQAARSGPAALDGAEPGPEDLAPPKAETDASWARVTEAMKKRDYAAAHAALTPLLDSSDGETKDSARLVRVRLELGGEPGKNPDARWLTELEDLAKDGSTSSIRASARRLLETLRSTEPQQAEPPPAETKHPEAEGELP